MPKMIQLRNVPDALHRKLKAHAAGEGVSLSEYLKREARKLADRPTLEEFRTGWEKRPVLDISPTPTEIIREARDRS